jgi:hypothetical protein
MAAEDDENADIEEIADQLEGGDEEAAARESEAPDIPEQTATGTTTDMDKVRADKVVALSQLLMNFLYSWGQRVHNNPLDKGEVFVLSKFYRFVYGLLDKGQLSPTGIDPRAMEQLYEHIMTLEQDADWIFEITNRWQKEKDNLGVWTMAEAKYIRLMWSRHGPEIEEAEGTQVKGILFQAFMLKRYLSAKLSVLQPDIFQLVSYLPPIWAAARMGIGYTFKSQYGFETANLGTVS